MAGHSPSRPLPSPADWDAARAAAVATASALGRPPPALDPTIGDTPLPAIVAEHAARHPDALAASDGVDSLTRRDWVRLMERYAGAVVTRLSGPGPVGVMVPAGIHTMPALFGVWRAGRGAVLLDPRHPAERNGTILRAAGAAGVIIGPGQDSHGWPALHLPPDTAPIPSGTTPLHPDAPCLIVTTSGSTGTPKLIVQSNRILAHRAASRAATLELTADDRVFLGNGSPTAFTETTHSLACLVAGAAILLSDLRRHGLRGLVDQLTAERPTVLRMTVSLSRALTGIDGLRQAFRHVRKVRLSGERPLPSDFAAMRALLPPGCVLQNGYASTETIGFSWDITGDIAPGTTHLPAGLIEAGAEALILDPAGRPLPRGQAGELVIRSRYTALGDWVDGALSQNRLIPDPTDPTQRIHFTGDRALWDEHGLLVVLGREDRQFKLNGLRVEPAEIEQQLLAWPDVRDAIALAGGDAAHPVLLAFIETTQPFDRQTLASLRQHLLDRLPRHMVPARIVARSALPRLHTGKIDARALLTGAG